MDGKGSGTIARDDCDIQVVLSETAELGRRATAKVTEAKSSHLMARLVS